MTLLEFANVFTPLAIQLRQTDADEATIRSYYEPLKDVPPEFLTMAAQRLAKESAWFPKTSEWRAMALKIAADRLAKQNELKRRSPVPLCAACDDTGWIEAAADPRTLYSPQVNRETGELELVPLPASLPRQRCACEQIRRDELLGRRPWPALPAHTEPDRDAVERVDQMISTLARHKTMRPLSAVERVDRDEGGA